MCWFDGVVRWIPGRNLHFTLKFLGDVENRRVPELCSALQRAAESLEHNADETDRGDCSQDAAPGTDDPVAAFELAGLGCFPPRGRARVVWAGVRPKGPGLLRCYNALEAEFAELGFVPETRPFAPHVTLGRVRGFRDVAALRAAVETRDFAGPHQRPGEIVLFESTPTPSGVEYVALARVPIRGPKGTQRCEALPARRDQQGVRSRKSAPQ